MLTPYVTEAVIQSADNGNLRTVTQTLRENLGLTNIPQKKLMNEVKHRLEECIESGVLVKQRSKYRVAPELDGNAEFENAIQKACYGPGYRRGRSRSRSGDRSTRGKSTRRGARSGSRRSVSRKSVSSRRSGSRKSVSRRRSGSVRSGSRRSGSRKSGSQQAKSRSGRRG